jgi:prenylcysteine oxidase / farnesylcysteine lyase
MDNRNDSSDLKLAIIGTGIAGSASAHFARKQFGSRISISVFERDGRVGGRMEHRPFAGTVVETGGTLIHSSNHHVTAMMAEVGLGQTSPQDREGDEGSTAGIFDGRGITFRSSKNLALSGAKMLFRYGLSPVRTGRAVKEQVDRWARIYELQHAGKSYQTPEEMFAALGLIELCREPSPAFFRRNGIGGLFVSEFVDGISRNNYGQGSTLHAFANVISLAGAGFAGGTLFSIEGGNAGLAERLLRQSDVDLRLNTPALRIRGPEPGERGYRLLTVDGATESIFDAVIIAAPLEVAAIEIKSAGIEVPIIADRRFQITHATFVAGQLNPAFFGAPPGATLPGTILTVEDPKIWFSSVGRVGFSPAANNPVYKIFSREALIDSQIDLMFRFRSEVERVVWRAYPVLSATAVWPAFELAPGLYYPNAMESAVSTIETEAVAARNVAGLLKTFWDCPN